MLGQKITQGVYNAVKLMLNDGYSPKAIADHFEISYTTVSNIKLTNNYDGYKKRIRKNLEGFYGNDKPVESSKATVYTTFSTQKEIEKTNILLEKISNDLAFIVKELTGPEGRK